jgi:hypothetical protein
MSPHVPYLPSLLLAGLTFGIVAALLAWRLWVGVEPKGRRPVLAAFATTFLLMAGSRRALGMGDFAGSLLAATGAYTACLLVTRGRPERMLEVWKITDLPRPSRAVRRSVTLHQLAFCFLLIGGLGFYYWTSPP